MMVIHMGWYVSAMLVAYNHIVFCDCVCKHEVKFLLCVVSEGTFVVLGKIRVHVPSVSQLGGWFSC